MGEENNGQKVSENEKKKSIQRKQGGKRGYGVLHLLQHVLFVTVAVLLVAVLFGSHVAVKQKDGIVTYSLPAGQQETAYEDSELFGRILGNSVSDVICLGAIKGQLETNGRFDPKKEIDVTAYANRYEGLKDEYITARYYAEDLIKWAQNGFESSEVYLSGEEAEDFLNRYHTVTFVNLNENYRGGTVSYFNSDASSHTRVVDVSANLAQGEENIRDDVNATLLKNRYRTVDGKNIEDYVSSWEEYDALCGNVKKAAEDLLINYEEYLKYQDYYDRENTNLVYYIRKTVGKNTTVFSNQKVTATGFAGLKNKLTEQCKSYIIYDPKNMIYETDTPIEEETLRYILNGYEYAYPEDTQILIGVNTSYPVTDAFTQGKAGYESYTPYFWQYLAGAICAAALYALLLVWLTAKEGSCIRRDTGEKIVRMQPEDKLPTEILLLIAAAAGVGITLLGDAFISGILGSFDKWSTVLWFGEKAVLFFTAIFALLISMAFSFFYYSLVRRIKAGTLWKNSLLRKLLCLGKKSILYLYDNAAVVLRVFVPYGAFVLFHVVVLAFSFLTRRNAAIVGIPLLILGDGIIGFWLYRSATARQKILQGIRRIQEGDIEHQVDETNFHGDNLVLAQAVNSIGEGIREAVETSMKDERMKADLITNVSHDIKTPLTSIINYVDLIKRENVGNQKVREYIEVLDVKSQRLKQLTDDLVEASKISSGNIILQWEKINLVELLYQTIGEFSEKFEQKSLTPVFRTGKNSVFIEADSRRIWRVIENLFNNIYKYALEGTRVYIDLEERKKENGKGQVILSVRNISQNPLKVNTEELTERFIRGDESRTTEGSGLGLSIAKNLTEAQKGKLEIVVDGDLFKVILTFPLLEEA